MLRLKLRLKILLCLIQKYYYHIVNIRFNELMSKRTSATTIYNNIRMFEKA